MTGCGNNAEPTGNGAGSLPQPLAGRRCLVLDDDLLIALDIEQILQARRRQRSHVRGNSCRRVDGGA